MLVLVSKTEYFCFIRQYAFKVFNTFFYAPICCIFSISNCFFVLFNNKIIKLRRLYNVLSINYLH